MYTIQNQRVAEAVQQNGRTFRALLDFGDDAVSGADVGSITTEHSLSDDLTLAIGRVLSRRAELTLYTRKPIRRGDAFRLYVYLLDSDAARTDRTSNRALAQWTHRELSMFTHEEISTLGRTKDPDGVPMEGVYIPMGEFVISKVLLRAGALAITAYDRLSAAEKPYTPGTSFPAGADAVVTDALSQLGITAHSKPRSGILYTSDGWRVMTASGQTIICAAEYSFSIPAAPEGMTVREVLGAIAAVYGGNGILDRDGSYTTAFVGTHGYAIDHERIDEPELSEQDVQLTGILCTLDDDATITAGDPEGVRTLEITCPWMTQERLATIWGRLSRLAWRPTQIHERLGNPCRDFGDLCLCDISGTRYTVPVMSLTYQFDGGISADITASDDAESE